MDQHLKERLTGAVVLTTLAVIIIPIILTGSPSLDPGTSDEGVAGTHTVDAELQPFSSKIVPLGTATPLNPATPAPKQASGPATIPALPKPVPPATNAGGTPEQPPKRQVTTEAMVVQTPTVKAAVPGGWLVQLGSFSNARNAAGLKERLRKKAYSVFTYTSKSDGGEVTRVFVGPSASRQQATKLAARLFRETRLKGMVIRQP